VDPAPIPVLHTERLLLRGWRPPDFEAHAEMCADPEVQRFLGGPLDRAESWRSMALSVGHWVLRGYGNWVLERRSDGRVVGRAGLWYPEGWFGIEVTWKLARDAWGHGYATEAARATLDWAWPTLDTDILISVIDPANTASMRVAERIGMRRLREDEAFGKTIVILGIDRPNDRPTPTPYSV
jgi:RimJ/RimL family protein N-acetyltransferase